MHHVYHVYALRVKTKPFSVAITKISLIKSENKRKKTFENKNRKLAKLC